MITIELLSPENFSETSLDSYVRTHEVKRVYRKIGGGYSLVELPYTEDWTLERKREIARDISGSDYITYLALNDGKVIGFISLKKQLADEYMILDSMHVSAEFRGMGTGRKLFELGKQEAKNHGAKALYISACSSEETIAFYTAMGARLTDNPIREMADAEPCDLQMTCEV